MPRLAVLIVALLFVAAVVPAPLRAQEVNSPDVCIPGLTASLAYSGAPVVETAEALGCRRLLDGTWVVGTVGDPAPFLGAGGADPARVAAMRDAVQAMALDPRFTIYFAYDVAGETLHFPTGGFDGPASSVSLTDQPVAQTPQWVDVLGHRDTYRYAADAYFADPANVAIAQYAWWLMGRRDAAISAVTAVINPYSAEGIRSGYGYQAWPWMWQLADPFTIDRYLSSGSM